MFYRPGEPHGLPHNPFNAMVVPRPIGWISTLNEDGTANLAPYSFFNAAAYGPPQVIFCSNGQHGFGGYKDSLLNIERSGEFVHNLASAPLLEAMNASSVAAPHGVDEFDLVGLEKAPSALVKPPRVALSPVHFECRLVEIISLRSVDPENLPNRLVIGEVVGIHIDDAVIVDGRIAFELLQPISRLGYLDFINAATADVFAMPRPKWQEPES